MKTNKVSIYVSNKSNEVLLYHEKTKEYHTNMFNKKADTLINTQG